MIFESLYRTRHGLFVLVYSLYESSFSSKNSRIKEAEKEGI